MTIEVEDIRTNNLYNAKKHKTAIQAGPSGSKNLVKEKRMERSSDAAWVSRQRKKIIGTTRNNLRGDIGRDEHKDKKKLDKERHQLSHYGG